MPTIHDSGYKRLFKNKSIFRQLIETFVREDFIKDFDFDDCEIIDKSFVSAHYKATESDIIYKTKLKGKEAYIFVLIEFQSTVDNFMPLRILNYITNFYMDYVQSNKGIKKLPALFPIMLYNGDAQWTAPVSILDLIENNEFLGRFAINFEYFKIAENEYSEEDLLKIKNIVSTLFLAEAHYNIETLKEEFLAVFRQEKDKQAISIFLNWFKQLSEHRRIDKADYKELERIYKNEEEVQEMLITALEKERKELYNKGYSVGIETGMKTGIQRGIKTGMEKGFVKGIEKERMEIVRNMLLNNEPINKIMLYTNLLEKEILSLKSKLKN